MSSVSGKFNVDVSLKPSVIRESTDTEGLNTYESLSIATEAYVSKNGFPVVPKLWAKVQTFGSLEGIGFDSTRVNPYEVDLGSDLRFIADDWVPDAGTWEPSMGAGGYFRSYLATRPYMRDNEYVSGKELLVRNSVRFSAGAFAYSDIPNFYFTDLTISFAGMLNSSPSTYPLFDFFDPAAPEYDPGENRTALLVTDKIDYLWRGTGNSVDPINSISKARPIYLTVCYGQREATAYVCYSPKHTFATSQYSSSRNSPPLKIALGRSFLGPQPADFDLFEINIWNRALTQDEVGSLNASYISTYGVHSDWS